MNHIKYMKIALDLAKKGKGFTSPNPMVGSIIVKENKIIGRGYHKKFGSDHAEVEAINNAGIEAHGATLYVTLEPCNHYGKTPPCTKKIIDSGVSHVVFAMKDPNMNVNGKGEEIFKKNKIKVTSGICEKEALNLNEYFIKHVNTGFPFVIVKCAATLDGRIATKTGNSKWITGYKARQYVHEMRHSVDLIMVGKNTIIKDNPKLTTRLSNKKGVDPVRVVLDTKLSIPYDSKVITQQSTAKTYIVTGKNVDKNRVKIFEKLGAIIIPIIGKNKRLSMIKLLKLLGNMNFNSLLIEGGSEVMFSALSLKIVDKICFFYAPKILMGNDGIPMFNGFGPNMMRDSIQVHNMSLRRFGNDIMFQGYLHKKNLN